MFRLLGLLGGLSVALDLGTGSADDESLKRSVVAARFARRLGGTPAEVSATLYTALLQHLGCTAYSSEMAHLFGDDITATRAAFLSNFDDRMDLFRTWLPEVSHGTGRSKARVLASTMLAARTMEANGPLSTCEVATDAARRLDLPEAVRESVHAALAQWNGKGFPELAGHAIPLATRIVHVAGVATLFALHAGPDVALEQVRRRAGTQLDPELAAAFIPDLLDGLDEGDAYAIALDAEPDPVVYIDDARLLGVARTFGDLADLKSPWFTGHSTAVGDLAGEAATLLGLDGDTVRIAGYLHDLGKVAVSSRVWDKPGALSASETDKAHLHPYFTERILVRVPVLAEVAAIAGSHHERLDGSGYHRAVTAAGIAMPARVLAAADRYRCLVEARPHRDASSPADAAGLLVADVNAGRLDGDAVTAALEAAGHRRTARRPRPADLTQRQVEVLRLVAAGMSNPEIGRRLGISARTAERHVQDVYLKIGVRTRARAALFAMEHGLVEETA